MSSSEHPGTPQRPPASAYLLVDSLDRYGVGWPANDKTATTSSNWKLNFQTASLYGYMTRIALTQLNFQWNIPTILAGYNDRVFIVVNSNPVVQGYVVLDQGWYTPDALATEIETKLQALAPANNFTCIFNDTSGCFQIDGTNEFWFIPPNGATPTADGLSNVLIRTYLTLGFLGKYNNQPATLSNRAFGGVPTMVATRFIDICSSYLTKYQRVKDSSTLINSPRQDMIARLYPVAPNTRINLTGDNSQGSTPFNICVDYNTPKHSMWSPDEAVANFDIQVRDEFGDLLPWNTDFGCEYQMTFLATET